MASGIIRIGILGSGAMAATHAAAYADMAGVQLAGVFGRDPARLARFAERCGAAPVSDMAGLLDDSSLDAIDVCLPSANHPEAVIAALGKGKHVFCETPMALRLDDAGRMRDAARQAGRLLQVGLLMRSVGPYAHLQAAAVSGAHGRLLGFTAWRLGSYLRPGNADHKPHYSEPSTELMTFDFDVAQWLMGRPVKLMASAVRTMAGGAGEITALLAYDDGRHATVIASGLMPRGAAFSVGCRALFEAAAFELQTVFADGPPRNQFTIVTDDAPPRPVAVPQANPYQLELQRFVDCIHGRADPQLLDAERAIEALVLSTATQRSLAEGRAIDIASVG